MQQRYVVTCGFEEASVTVPSRSLLHYHNGSKGPTFQHQVLLTKLKGALKRIQVSCDMYRFSLFLETFAPLDPVATSFVVEVSQLTYSTPRLLWNNMVQIP